MEGKVSIEQKGLELKRLNDFAGYNAEIDKNFLFSELKNIS